MRAAGYAAALGIPLRDAWTTPVQDLDLMLSEKARLNGKSFTRELLPHEQETKAEGMAFARRLEASLAVKPRDAD